MNWVFVTLVFVLAIGVSAWLVLGVDDTQPMVDDDSGVSTDWDRPAKSESLTAEGDEPVDPAAMGNIMGGKMSLPIHDGFIHAEELLGYLRSRTRVVFKPGELENRFKEQKFDVSEEIGLFEEGGAVGADFHRLMVDAGFLVDDHQGVMVVTEGVAIER